MTAPPGPQPGGPDADPLAGLHDVLGATRPGADVGLVRRAYDAAEYWHRGQLRLSGDPYITHPVAVATILAGLSADDQTLCAAMLHDTIGETPCTLAVLDRGFGAEIATMVAEFTTLRQLSGSRRLKAARVRATAGSADPRVLAMSLADRLHNMRTLQFLPQAKQLRKAREALELFVPFARQLNLDTTRAELETLASAALQRNRRADTVSERVLSAATAMLLPAATRTRWREEWLAELHTLPGRRDRAKFAAHTLPGVPRLAVTLRLPAAGGRPPCITAGTVPSGEQVQMRPPRPVGLPHHRAIIAVDIERSTSRTNPVKAELRSTAYELFDAALRSAGIQVRHRDRFIDRGDGILALIHPVDEAPTALLLTRAIPALHRRIADRNDSLPRASQSQRQLRARVVVHAGDVHYDANGCFGEALDLAFRLLDAAQLKKALRAANDPLALVVSEEIYRSVVRHEYDGIDQRAFRPLVRVQIAGHHHTGWICIPGEAARHNVTEMASYRQPA